MTEELAAWIQQNGNPTTAHRRLHTDTERLATPSFMAPVPPSNTQAARRASNTPSEFSAMAQAATMVQPISQKPKTAKNKVQPAPSQRSPGDAPVQARVGAPNQARARAESSVEARRESTEDDRKRSKHKNVKLIKKGGDEIPGWTPEAPFTLR